MQSGQEETEDPERKRVDTEMRRTVRRGTVWCERTLIKILRIQNTWHCCILFPITVISIDALLVVATPLFITPSRLLSSTSFACATGEMAIAALFPKVKAGLEGQPTKDVVGIPSHDLMVFTCAR